MRLALALALLLGCSPPEDDEPVPAVTLETLATAEAVAAQGMERWEPERLYLGWIETVWAYGLLRLERRNSDPALLEYVDRWLLDDVDAFTAEPPRAFDSSDSMSPATLASLRLQARPELEPLIEAAHAYLEVAHRTDEGAITHWYVDTPFVDNDEIWVDSLFMFGMFILAEHARTGDRAHLERFVEQYVLFSELCRDPVDQLYRHAYDDGTGSNIPPDDTYWARGNSWVLLAGAQMLSQVPEDDPAYQTVAPLVVEHARAILALQAEDGLWRTVINSPRGEDPDNYTETSGSALLAYGLLRGMDTVLPAETTLPAVVRAVQGVKERVKDRAGAPVVTGTSYGTNPGGYDYYLGVPTGDDLMLGMGTVVLLLAGADGLVVEEGT